MYIFVNATSIHTGTANFPHFPCSCAILLRLCSNWRFLHIPTQAHPTTKREMTRSFRPCPSVLQKSEEHTESRRNIDRDKPRQHSITAYAGEREGEITWNSEPDISHKKKPNPVSCSCFHYIACNFLVLNAALHVFLLFIIDASSLFSVVFRVGELREWCNCRERRSSRPRLSSMRHNIYANAYFRPTTMTFWEFNCVIHYITRTNTHTHTPRQTDNKLFLNTEKLFAAFFIEQECFFFVSHSL